MTAPTQIDLRPAADHERRRDVRYRLEAPGLVAYGDAVYDCVVADISVGGALLEGDLPFEVGGEIALGFDSVLGLTGDVMHRGDGFVGVRFSGDARQKAMLVAWLRSSIRKQRGKPGA